MDRILAIDYGERRIGLAVSDPLKIIASPLSVIDRKKTPDILEQIQIQVSAMNISTVVVGLPLNMKGNDTEQTTAVRDFIDILRQKLSIPVDSVDERLSSQSARVALIQRGIKTGHNKGLIDKTAAVIFLQEYLDSRSVTSILK